MTEFIQLHVITSYPPSNLNRDDLGRPKTAIFGGQNRIRVSSQSLKRAWRQSSIFEDSVGISKGIRTREVGKQWVFARMKKDGVADKVAIEAAQTITAIFGKADDDEKANKMLTKQLVHVSPEEKQAIDDLVGVLIAEKRVPTQDETELLRHNIRAADIALFGRMLADKPNHNVEAAAQVAHAITVHSAAIEDDYFTAVDDLNNRQDNVGAGHVGEIEFAAGVFYIYLCIDQSSLVRNLQGDSALAQRTLRGLIEAVCTIAPSGKQNTFASRAYASLVLAERGAQQPRSLSVAFLDPLLGPDYVGQAGAALHKQVENFDKAYGATARDRFSFDVAKGEGTLAELIDFVSQPAKATS